MAEDNLLNNINPNFFEGVEKLLEIWFAAKPGADLRKIPRYNARKKFPRKFFPLFLVCAKIIDPAEPSIFSRPGDYSPRSMASLSGCWGLDPRSVVNVMARAWLFQTSSPFQIVRRKAFPRLGKDYAIKYGEWENVTMCLCAARFGETLDLPVSISWRRGRKYFLFIRTKGLVCE